MKRKADLRRPVLRCAAVLALSAPALAWGAVRLAPVMHGWQAQRRAVEAILDGGRPYDAAALRQAMVRYAADAQAVAGSVRGDSAAARDFAARFTGFAGDARRAEAAAADPAGFRARFAALRADCEACHQIYNN